MASATSTNITAPTATLSSHDNLVLASILNPESLPATTLVDPSLPGLHHTPPALLSTLQSRETLIIRPLNKASPSSPDIQNALTLLGNLITEHPEYAPAYNNRAQATRMLWGDNLRDKNIACSTLWTDLGKAIELAAPPSPYAAVSPLQSKVLASAYTHRGHLTWRLAKSMDARLGSDNQSADQEKHLLPPQLQGKSKEQLEEMASRDFEMGGRYGNDVAREMAVRTNPYAKLCGDIVKEAMRGEMLGMTGEV